LAQETSNKKEYKGFANFKDTPTHVIREWVEDMRNKDYHKILLKFLGVRCNAAAIMTLKPSTLVEEKNDGRGISFYQGQHDAFLSVLKFLETVEAELAKRREHNVE
jgi:hypothetical protein